VFVVGVLFTTQDALLPRAACDIFHLRHIVPAYPTYHHLFTVYAASSPYHLGTVWEGKDALAWRGSANGPFTAILPDAS